MRYTYDAEHGFRFHGVTFNLREVAKGWVSVSMKRLANAFAEPSARWHPAAFTLACAALELHQDMRFWEAKEAARLALQIVEDAG